MTNAAAVLECTKVAVDSSDECLTIFLPRPGGIEGARLNMCQSCGWSKPKGVAPTCAHAALGPLILLSPPHKRHAVSVADRDCLCGAQHTSISAHSVMPWWTRRWLFEYWPSTSWMRPATGGRRARGSTGDRWKGLIIGTGAILDMELDSAGRWAWLRANNMAWDNTERKGAVPGKRASGADVERAPGDDGWVDDGKLLARQWRRRMKELPLDDHAYRAYRRRLREISWRSLTAEPSPKARKWKGPRFSPALLTPEGLAKWEAENRLNRWLGPLERYEDERPRVDGSRLDYEGRDGGWARHVGTRRADKLLARRRALERLEDEVDSRLLHGDDLATVAKFDTERLIEVADATYYEPWLPLGPYPAEIRWSPKKDPEYGYQIPYVRRFLVEGEPLETSLKRVAAEGGQTVEFVRSFLADLLEPLREPLGPWSRGRTGRGVGVASGARGVHLNTDAGYYRKDLPGGNGRPRDHDPRVVRAALMRADAYLRRMLTAVAVNGGGRSVPRASEVGVDLFFAARIHPIAPTLYECVVAAGKTRLGMQTSVRTLTRVVSAANTGVPVEALTALERALK